MSATKEAGQLHESQQQHFEAELDSLIQALKGLKFSKHRRGISRSTASERSISSPTVFALPTTPPQQTSLPSPPPTPRCKSLNTNLASGMNRSLLHGRPPAGSYGRLGAQSDPQQRGSPTGDGPRASKHSFQELRGELTSPSVAGGNQLRTSGLQHAQSNFAVQPAVAPAKVNLKKAAVKFARPAGIDSEQPKTASQIAFLEKQKPEEIHGDKKQPPSAIATAAAPVLAASDELREAMRPPNVVNDALDSVPSTLSARKRTADDLAARYAKLQTLRAAREAALRVDTTTEKPERKVEVYESKIKSEEHEHPPVQHDKLQALQTIKEEQFVTESSAPKTGSLLDTSSTIEHFSWRALPIHLKTAEDVEVAAADSMSIEELEQQYLHKATEYLDSVLAGDRPASSMHLLKTAAEKLRDMKVPVDIDTSAVADDTKRAYAEALVAYIDNKSGPIDLFNLYVKLVNDHVSTFETLEQVVDLCKTILEVVPPTEAYAPPFTENKTPSAQDAGPSKVTKPADQPLLQDPIMGVTVWPAQQKRENMPGCRTAMLKGVSTMNTVNKAQALIWGGRLEWITVDTEKSQATVRFLSVEACQKYLDATANGIEVEDQGTKFVVMTDCMPGPNSVNDLLRNCNDGDASRCIRVADADEDWGDKALMRLAAGTSKVRREVDCIKRGRLANGRNYIEFRFSNIYHALSFKRALMDDEEWEHCSISYAADPCEAAKGVHMEDVSK